MVMSVNHYFKWELKISVSPFLLHSLSVKSSELNASESHMYLHLQLDTLCFFFEILDSLE